MNILIIDENEVVRRQIFWALQTGNALREAANREQAEAELARSTPDVILTELLQKGDPDESAGRAMVLRLLQLSHRPFILVITRSERKDIAASLLDQGLFDYLHKPLNLSELPIILKRVERRLQLQPERGAHPPSAQTILPETREELGIIGVDARIKHILEQVHRIAATPVSVLITGETGVGKEVFAKAIHALSERPVQRFVPLNCAVLSDTLVEDELFGHEKGAFTGAVERRMGKFELANKGTLFLDEIGDLGLHLQAKFLRVLQERQFERLGGNAPLHTDFRLICATHRDLQRMIREQEFREDLMFRINVISFHIPPLRERKGDIRLFARAFLEEYAHRFNRKGISFSREVLRFMDAYPWPGNVRELKHFVERSVALSDGRTITGDVLPEAFPTVPAGEPLAQNEGGYDRLVKNYKRQLVMEALEMAGQNKLRTAELLGISRSYLFKLIKQLAVPS